MHNARYERLAQALASGARTRFAAYAVAYRQELTSDLERTEWAKTLTKSQENAIYTTCRRPDIQARIKSIMTELHDRRMNAEEREFQFPRASVLRGLYEVYQRASQLVPVLDSSGRNLGVYKPDYNGSIKALELLGTEIGMFVKQHHHLHKNSNPLEGGRAEVLGSIRVLTDGLSDADLRELGLQRLEVVDASSKRTNGTGDQPGQTLPAVP